jgi:ATP synthase protein I
MVRAVSGAAETAAISPENRGCRSMNDDAREEEDRDPPATEETALSARLRSLGEQLDRHHPGRPSEDGARSRSSAMARGFQLSTELVAGVLVGAGIGWLLDRWLGISPWGMIVFLLLGFAAGILNVMRGAGLIQQPRMGPPDRSQ